MDRRYHDNIFFGGDLRWHGPAGFITAIAKYVYAHAPEGSIWRGKFCPGACQAYDSIGYWALDDVSKQDYILMSDLLAQLAEDPDAAFRIWRLEQPTVRFVHPKVEGRPYFPEDVVEIHGMVKERIAQLDRA